MSTATLAVPSKPKAKKSVWIGRAVGVPVIGLLLFSAGMKFFPPPEIAEMNAAMGWSREVIVGIGVVELICTLLYAVPATSVLGAVLLTGYLGGAIATHVRMGDSFAVPAALGVVLWIGLALREPRIWSLLPLRTKPPAA